MSTISYLALDASNDPVFADTTSLTDIRAVSQTILTRLKLFLGEWWENLAIGLPVFQSMLGQLGSQSNLAIIQGLVQQNIQGAPYVTNVTSIQVAFVDGVFTFTAVAQTSFGTVTVSNAPGASASL